MTANAKGDLEVEVVNNTAASQYEARIDGELAGLASYRLHGDRVVFPHVEVMAKWEGRGVGSVLASGALDDVIAQGKQIVPLCPFVVGYLRRNPSYLPHVDEKHRHELEAAVPDL